MSAARVALETALDDLSRVQRTLETALGILASQQPVTIPDNVHIYESPAGERWVRLAEGLPWWRRETGASSALHTSTLLFIHSR